MDRIVAANRTVHQQRLAGYLAEECPPQARYQRATLEFGIRYERAVLGWFDDLAAILDGRPPG